MNIIPHNIVQTVVFRVFRNTSGVLCLFWVSQVVNDTVFTDYGHHCHRLGRQVWQFRIRADVLFAYKLLFGLTALHSDDFFILRESTCTRGHPYKLYLPRCSTGVRKYFFSQRIVKLWNELPANTDFSSIESFKRTLEGFILMLIVTFNTRS